MPPMVNLLFPPVVKAFRERHPAVSLRLQENGGQVIEQQVASGELEVGATLLPADPALGLDSRSFGRYPMFVVGPRHARLGTGGNGDLTALRDEPLLLLADDFSLTRRIREAFVVAGFEAAHRGPKQPVGFSRGDGRRRARHHADAGPAARPPQHRRRAGLYAPRSPRRTLDWNVALIWKPGRYMSHAARAWLKVCEDVLATPAVS
jgi:DNA-binding transcriptional LysR family regulator